MNYLLLIFELIILTINISKAQNSTICLTTDNKPGLCIELHRCRHLYNSVESHRSSQQNSSLNLSICGNSNENVMYCCGLRSIIPKPIIPTTTRGPIIDDTRTWVCGSGVMEPYTYGLKEAKRGEFPWMALLEYTTSDNAKIYDCEGSLIHNRYVITSAFCIKGMPHDWSLTGVRLGEWDKSTSRDCITDSKGDQECSDPHIDVPVEKAIARENYMLGEHVVYNNIGLLRLARQIQFTDWVSPICLPTKNSLRIATFDRVAFHIAGWREIETANSTQILSKAMVVVNSLSTCKLIYSKFKLGLREDEMCAGGVPDIDLCFGVPGTALIGLDTKNKLRNSYFLAGVYSFRLTPCNFEGIPSVYTRVGPHVEWILANIQT